ncbi:hypothetical protein [Paraburkholderia sp. OAS925]|uniref:hypothetical protein n=1 Tax=Paraburkholderia sp. OAS925 TaxID=2663827 RepID=UPI0019F8B88D
MQPPFSRALAFCAEQRAQMLKGELRRPHLLFIETQKINVGHMSEFANLHLSLALAPAISNISVG